jgi:hypothetical protein
MTMKKTTKTEMRKRRGARFVFGARYSPPAGVPEDEWALALAIHAAKARDLRWCEGEFFEDASYQTCGPKCAVFACALGALHLAGVKFGKFGVRRRSDGLSSAMASVFHGNDWPMHEQDEDEDLDPGAFAVGSGYANALGKD